MIYKGKRRSLLERAAAYMRENHDVEDMKVREMLLGLTARILKEA